MYQVPIALFLASVAATHPARVLVLPFRPLGIEADRAASLTVLFRGQIEKLGGFALAAEAESAAAVPKVEACGGKGECLARVLRGAGADLMVLTVAGALGDTYTLDLKLLDTGGKERRRVSQQLGGADAVLIEGARSAAVQLLAPEQYTGALMVQTEFEAEVQLDGKAVGKTPLTGPVIAAVGPRALKITKPGYRDFDQFVEIRFGQTTFVKVDLKNSTISGVLYALAGEAPPPEAFTAAPAPPPPAPGPAPLRDPPRAPLARGPTPAPEWVWPAALGTGAAALGTLAFAVYFGLDAQSIEGSLAEKFRKRTLGDADQQRYAEMYDQASTANMLYLVSGVLGVLGGAGMAWSLAGGAVEVAPAPGGLALQGTLP